ncbi:MAG: PAS domain S-box protein [Lyngbya sp. HA4199-MV5]|jgi:PAS domain S-box-containing protein|nr:PAS domain S-box protein [Lyngbya sp. HA4199-MV5]
MQYLIEKSREMDSIPSSQPIKILLVEDNEDDYVLTRDLLADVQVPQFDLEWAATYETALVSISQQRHDIYLLDYHLGEHNGLDVLRHLLSRDYHAPIILLSGAATRTVDLEAMQLGATDFLYKDEISVGLLERSLRYALKHKQTELLIRKIAEDASRSQQQYHALVNSIDGIIWESNTDQFRFNFVSHRAERLLGYPIEEWLTEPTFLQDHIHPGDRAQVLRFYVNHSQGQQPQEFEFRMMAADGQTIWLRNIFTGVVENNHLTKLRGVMVDITQQRQIEDALSESKGRYRAVMEQSIECICLISASTKQIIEANPATERLLGYTLEELWDRTIYDLFADDPAILDERIRENGSSRHFYLGESQYRHKNGALIDVSVSISLIAYQSRAVFCMIARDVTEQKQAEAILRQQAEREAMLREISQQIRRSLNLPTILSTATAEIARCLRVDEAEILHYKPEQECWQIVAQYCQDTTPCSRSLGLVIADHPSHLTAQLKRTQLIRIDDFSSCHDSFKAGFAPIQQGAWLLVPLPVGSIVWGCLSLLRSQLPVLWQDAEVELIGAVVDQLAIAIQQSELYSQVQQLNIDLEGEVQNRTAELQLAYDFEATVKHIMEKVRDSLDEDQILQTAVQELASTLGVKCCNAALFNLEAGTSTVHYEYSSDLPPVQGRVSQMDAFPELYSQLLDSQTFQFCSLLVYPERGQVTMLTSSIFDDQGVLGDLWLIDQSYRIFSQRDLQLVQQVANQCAIALRQARLYHVAQTQVEELERLNRLKDDFLSTVSHELRSPMASIKIATKMLEITLQPTGILDTADSTAARYLQILRSECNRETSLINDLLDLARLDAGTDQLNLTPVDLSTWIADLVAAFETRTREQQQTLTTHLPPHLPTLTTDLSYLERILTELLHNACKYTPRGETITVAVALEDEEAAREGEEREPCLLSIAPSPALALNLQVSNSGVSIPASECDRVFDKFYRIPNNDPWKHGGTGLGLALVKKLTERLGATIHVESSQQRVTFTLCFPLAVAERV